jgi:hypothetical protein
MQEGLSDIREIEMQERPFHICNFDMCKRDETSHLSWLCQRDCLTQVCKCKRDCLISEK